MRSTSIFRFNFERIKKYLIDVRGLYIFLRYFELYSSAFLFFTFAYQRKGGICNRDEGTRKIVEVEDFDEMAMTIEESKERNEKEGEKRKMKTEEGETSRIR